MQNRLEDVFKLAGLESDYMKRQRNMPQEAKEEEAKQDTRDETEKEKSYQFRVLGLFHAGDKTKEV